MKYISAVGNLSLLLLLVSCATSHPDCLKSDAFGHCKQWKNQQQTCEKPDFLGFCPGKKN